MTCHMSRARSAYDYLYRKVRVTRKCTATYSSKPLALQDEVLLQFCASDAHYHSADAWIAHCKSVTVVRMMRRAHFYA
eukprot:1097702-Pleurochrysis_carterae.AAC.1